MLGLPQSSAEVGRRNWRGAEQEGSLVIYLPVLRTITGQGIKHFFRIPRRRSRRSDALMENKCALSFNFNKTKTNQMNSFHDLFRWLKMLDMPKIPELNCVIPSTSCI